MYKSEQFWNRLSPSYDKNAIDEAHQLIVEKSKKYFKTDDVLLDFACATGLYALEFAKQVKKIQAFDTSSKMIAIAKNKAKIGNIDNVDFAQTTLFDRQYKEGSFDIVLALNIILYFKDEKIVLDRMNKLVKKGGLIITSTACLKEKRTLIGMFSGGIIYLLRLLKILPYLKFYKMKALEKIITNGGFKVIETAILIDKPATEYFIVAQKL